MITLYTTPALNKATGIGMCTLRMWKEKKWLKAFTYAGSRPYYRMEDFEAAAALAGEARLKSLTDAIEPVVDTLENDQNYYSEIVKKHSAGAPDDEPKRVRRRVTASRKDGVP